LSLISSHLQAYANKPGFTKPWLLREFDQIHFYEVDQSGFDQCFEDFKTGRFNFDIRETTFDPAEYKRFIRSIAGETAEYERKRRLANLASGEEESRLLAEWHERQIVVESEKEEEMECKGISYTRFCQGCAQIDRAACATDTFHIIAPMTSSVWKMLVKVGDVIESGQTLAILEAMKMEIRKSASRVRGSPILTTRQRNLQPYELKKIWMD
jgi:urea carboxylase